jgi:hypothetical protein
LIGGFLFRVIVSTNKGFSNIWYYRTSSYIIIWEVMVFQYWKKCSI